MIIISLLTHMHAIRFYYLQLSFYKGLTGIAEAVRGEHCYCPEKGSNFHHLSSLKVSQCLPSIILRLNILNDCDASKVTDDGPADCCPYFVSLRLHELLISLVCQLMERYFWFVFVFFLQHHKFGVPFCLILQFWIVKLVLAHFLPDFYLSGLFSQTLSNILPVLIEFGFFFVTFVH